MRASAKRLCDADVCGLAAERILAALMPRMSKLPAERVGLPISKEPAFNDVGEMAEAAGLPVCYPPPMAAVCMPTPTRSLRLRVHSSL